MPKPASKITRVTLVCLCLLGLGFGLFWCGRQARAKTQMQKAVAWEKDAARLVMINESTCEWLVTIRPASDDEGKEWKMPVGKSAEVMLKSGEYCVEQVLLTEVGNVQKRSLTLTAEAGQVYRWRLVNLLSSDERELYVPVEGVGAK